MDDDTDKPNRAFKPTERRKADLAGPDFYPTPTWPTRALVKHEKFRGSIWEPACGDGAMARVLEETGCSVISSDLYDRGYGKSGVDFLKSVDKVDNVVTNPPYNSAEEFVQTALRIAKWKCAFLLRLAFLEGAKRYRTLFSKRPPTRIWVFSERITFYPAGAQVRGSGTTAYAWFVWDRKADQGKTEIRWLPPGNKPKTISMKPIANDNEVVA
ncbi:MAG TPA: hypothetical protein VHP35_01890 [Terriglobia bacterium]|nr:hypothetical protein [Terriglobia bacterium]